MLAFFLGCRYEDQLSKTYIYTYDKMQFYIPTNSLDSNRLPVVSPKNISFGFQLKEKILGDTMVAVKECVGICCLKLVRVSPVYKDPIIKFDMFSDRSFGPNFPAGASLNTFLYYLSGYNQLPKPIAEWNSQYKSVGSIPNMVGVNFPDTVKGKTLFISVAQKQSGRKMIDSIYVNLK